jgi:hypothetical protein
MPPHPTIRITCAEARDYRLSPLIARLLYFIDGVYQIGDV